MKQTKKHRETHGEILRRKRKENYEKNKERDLKKNKEYYHANKEIYKANRIKNQDRIRSVKLKKHYGITLDDYNRLLNLQKGRCVICRNVETMIDSRNGKPRALAVDHSHQTGKVRGLLCRKCNNGLGIFGENMTLLNRAIQYIKKHD